MRSRLVAHVDHRFAHVVLRDQLAILRRDAEPEQPRARLRAFARMRTVGRDPSDGNSHLLGSDDAAFVLDVKRDGLSGVAGLRTMTSSSSDAFFSTVRGVIDAIDLDVARQLLAANADREDGKLLCLQAEQGVFERRVRRVGAVGHEHDTGHRQAGQFFACAVSAGPSLVCAPSNVMSSANPGARPSTRTGTAHQELARQRFQQGALGRGELVAHELTARLTVPVRDLHAARIVQQHRDDILLIDCGADDERGTEQTEEDERERGDTQ